MALEHTVTLKHTLGISVDLGISMTVKKYFHTSNAISFFLKNTLWPSKQYSVLNSTIMHA